jgi:hypothetical protein
MKMRKTLLWVLFSLLVVLVGGLAGLNYLILAEAPPPSFIIEPTPGLKKETEAVAVIEPIFSFDFKMDTTKTPHAKIFVELGNEKTFIEEQTASFNVVERQQYSDLKIPPSAKIACKGYYAGLETVYIVEDNGSFWVVKKRQIDEESTQTEIFEVVKTIKY